MLPLNLKLPLVFTDLLAGIALGAVKALYMTLALPPSKLFTSDQEAALAVIDSTPV